MHFLRPSVNTAFFPAMLVAFAVLPVEALRYTLYSALAVPLWPIIQRLGWVYRDKPQFLTYPAAILVGVFWAAVLYLILCTLRRLFVKV
jgi:hypothetical protein